MRKMCLALLGGLFAVGGCATLRVTDPPRTADEQFLLTVAVRRAIGELSLAAFRDRRVFVDSTYLFDVNIPSEEQLFLLGELRNQLLVEGAALVESRHLSEIVIEVRAGAVGVNRREFLLGFPGATVPVGTVEVGRTDVPVIVPELAIVKSRRQRGYASVSVTAFWRDTGELVASTGPFIGRTERSDYWFFGIGPRTTGDIPPAED